RIADAEAALAMVQEKFPKTKIGVVGFSLGGATALALTGRHPDEVTSLVLWSSSGNLPVDFFGDQERIAGQREAIEKGESKIQDWAEMTLTREHLMGFIGYDLLGPLKAYEGALFSIRGTDDFLNRYEDQFVEAASGWREEFLILSGADHVFHTYNPESEYDERVIAATLLWLRETL
ncbi:MAG: alpha/beta fold hydrolase, partial [Verrucomicrobia bacterium]|nr:alpha/beta fold hydrolase [Verrucomicrobiota bacterium]